MVPFLVGSTAYNAHVQHMALALQEANRLVAFVTSGGGSLPRGWSRAGREFFRRHAPRLNQQLVRRAVTVAPELVETRWRWEVPRLVANRLNAHRIQDWRGGSGGLAL